MNTISQFAETTFPVKEYPALYIDNGHGKLTDKISNKETMHRQNGYKFIVREDTGDVISCMTDEYQLIDNRDILEKAIPIVNDKCGVLEEQKIFGGGARTLWRWKFPDIKVDVGNGDFVNPTTTIINSYDGSAEASAMAGAFRIVCANGLVIGYIFGKNSIKHSIWSKRSNIEEIIDSVIVGIENILKTDFPTLVNTKVNKIHIAKVLKLFPENQMQTLFNKMISNPPKTYWDLLNAATWVTTHGMKRNVEATHKFESKLYPMIEKFAKGEIAKA